VITDAATLASDLNALQQVGVVHWRSAFWLLKCQASTAATAPAQLERCLLPSQHYIRVGPVTPCRCYLLRSLVASFPSKPRLLRTAAVQQAEAGRGGLQPRPRLQLGGQAVAA